MMIQESMGRVIASFLGYLPTLAAAVGLLVGGWFVARVLSAVTRRGLSRTSLDERINTWIGGGRARPLQIDRAASSAVFYLVMLFTLVGFFQILSLDLITQPLNALLTEVSAFAPRLLGAAGLLVLAWIVAVALRRLVSDALSVADLDMRLAEHALEQGVEVPLGRTLADAVYWLVFLLFLPAVLDVLAIEGLLGPVQGAIDEILSFIPNLMAGTLILAVGWLIARLAQRITSRLLVAVGADSIPARLQIELAAGSKVSKLVGLIVYVLILVPVVISALEALEITAITTPATTMLSSILGAVPAMFAAALLLLIAYAVGKLVSGLITRVLGDAGVDSLLQKLGFSGSAVTEGRTLSEIAGSLALVAILLFAVIEAANLLGFVSLAGVLTDFFVFAGGVLLGVSIFAVGLWLGNVAETTVRESGVSQSKTLAIAAKTSVLVLAGAMALRQMGLGAQIIELAFGLVLGSVAVAAALAFGLGSREIAAEQVRRWRGDAAGR